MKDKHYWFTVPAIRDNHLYFAAAGCCLLLRIDLKDGSMAIEAEMPIEMMGDGTMEDYTAACLINENIFIFPHFGHHFLKYNLICKNFEKIPLSNIEPFNTLKIKNPYMNYVEENEKYVIAYGIKSGIIIRIDKKDGKYTLLTNWCMDLVSELCEDDFYLFSHGCLVGNILYIPFNKDNSILKIDIENDSCERIHIGNQDDIYHSITCLGNGKFYLTMFSACDIAFWDGTESSVKKINLDKETSWNPESNKKMPFCRVMSWDDFLVLAPFNTNRLMLYDTKSKIPSLLREEEFEIGIYAGMVMDDSTVYACVRRQHHDQLLMLDCANKKCRTIDIELSRDIFEYNTDIKAKIKLKSLLAQGEILIYENHEINLERFISLKDY